MYELERVQEKAVKMVSGLLGKTYEEKCHELNLQTLQERRQLQDMALDLVHKFVNGDTDISEPIF
jgi:hypothetical protein